MDTSFIVSPTVFAARLAISLLIGILVGLERAWAHKEVGMRTFAIISILGMLGSILGTPFALASVVGAFLLVAYVNLRSLLTDRSLEITTSASLMVVVTLGVLVGQGHVFAPIASAIIVTMLLAWKVEVSRFTSALAPEEIRSAVLLGLLGFVVYPLLPNHFVDKWQLINPREAWVTVVVLAGIGFTNYVLLRLYSTRGLYYTAVLGGFVNSTATVTELCGLLHPSDDALLAKTVEVVLLTRIAMFVRNLAILFFFAPIAIASAFWPLVVMITAAGIILWRKRDPGKTPTPELKLPLPVSLRHVLRFGLIFLAIQVFSALAERHTGHFGFLIVSFLGGLVSSASTTASAALLAAHSQITPNTAGVAIVLTSVSSALVNLPLIYQQTKHKALTRTLTAISVVVVVLGLVVMVLLQRFSRW
ncbi:MAG TPA: DUF4010 domain-containing protein [Terriglobales bacterium]|nr:DUF4010 domain-containing protein [Terriglobales bacterium]